MNLLLARGSLLEQIRMSSSSGQTNFVICDRVDQQPIRLNMTFPVAFIISNQEMVAMALTQFFPFHQKLDKRKQTLHDISTFLHTLVVFFESGGTGNDTRYESRSVTKSFTFLKFFTLRRFFKSSIAWSVSSFGSFGNRISKGSLR
jgi:hypothetical protein